MAAANTSIVMAIGGYDQPTKGTTDWHVPLNENFQSIATDVQTLADSLGVSGSVVADYPEVPAGTTDWHIPINENVAAIEADVKTLAEVLSQIQVIADFESGSPSDFFSGDVSAAAFNAAVTPVNESQVLELDSGGNFESHIWSISGDGLDNYPAKGDRFAAPVRVADVGRARVTWGHDPTAPAGNHYIVELDFGNGEVEIRTVSGGSVLLRQADAAVPLPASAWVEPQITWDDGTRGGVDNDILVDVIELASGDSLMSDGPIVWNDSDAIYVGNEAIGFYANDNGNDGNDLYFDYARLLSSGFDVDVGGYNQPTKGTTDWHIPLNENFQMIETDLQAIADAA